MATDDLACLVNQTEFEDAHTEADARWDAIFESQAGQLALEN